MSIVLEGITRRFGRQLVVDRLSLEVAEGELFVLLGSSGSGKSTVLRMIAGLTAMDAGRVILKGQDVSDLPPQERGTGFVFQNYSIFRHMTINDNIEFGLKIRNVPTAQRVEKREQLLDLIGLTGLGLRRANQLSGGQLQRVALARALAYDPKVLLLDEPFGALDVKIRSQVRRRLRTIQRQLGITAILVTHDQDEAFELADRIGVMERGKLLEVGPPEVLYREPRTSFVATFLGSGNILVGRAREKHAHFGSFVLPLPPDAPHEDGARVEVLMRPEDVIIGVEPSEHGALLGQGNIVENTFAGPIRRVRLRLPRLANTRQIAPRLAFGESGLVVDVVRPALEPVSEGSLFVSCANWRILDQSQPSVMACDDGVIDIGRTLATQMGAAFSLLGVTSDADGADVLQSALNKKADGALVRVRQGDAVEQIITEQSEAWHDVMVMDAGRPDRVQRVLHNINGAVLVVGEKVPSFKKLLVCTAAGEPGKSNVRMGGWLARRLGASVTLLYVLTQGEIPPARVQIHLDKAASDIRALDVPVEISIVRNERPAEGIVESAAQHDMVVLGGHGPARRAQMGLDHVTVQVLEQVRRPLLVVAWELE